MRRGHVRELAHLRISSMLFRCAVLCACIGLGITISIIPAIPIWEGSAFVFLAIGITVWAVLGATHPLAWMCTLYSIYFLVGVQNWVQPSSALGFRGYVSAEPTLRLADIGLLAFAAGTLLTVGFRRRTTMHGRFSEMVSADRAGRLLLAIGAIGLCATVAKLGIPILNIGIRSKASHGTWALLSYAIIPGGLLATMNYRSVRHDLAVILGCDLALVLLAYRSPVILFTGCFLLLRLLQGRIRQRTVILAGLALAVFAIGLFTYRLEAAGKTLVNQNVVPRGPFQEVPSLFPFYIGFSREGVAVLARLQEMVPSYRPYFHGTVQASMFKSLFHSTSPRQYVYDVAYGTEVAQTTLTPTIIGGPYLDFGTAGVIAEMLAVGMISGSLYRCVLRRRTNQWLVLSLSYWTTLAIMGIHTGLLDATSLFIMPGMAAGAIAVVHLTRGRVVERERAV